MAHEWILLIFAAFVCLIPVIVVFLIAPGGLLVRLAGSLATLVSFLLAGGLAWYLEVPPTEPLAAGLAIVSLLAGWQFSKLLDRIK